MYAQANESVDDEAYILSDLRLWYVNSYELFSGLSKFQYELVAKCADAIVEQFSLRPIFYKPFISIPNKGMICLPQRQGEYTLFSMEPPLQILMMKVENHFPILGKAF